MVICVEGLGACVCLRCVSFGSFVRTLCLIKFICSFLQPTQPLTQKTTNHFLYHRNPPASVFTTASTRPFQRLEPVHAEAIDSQVQLESLFASRPVPVVFDTGPITIFRTGECCLHRRHSQSVPPLHRYLQISSTYTAR